MKLRHGDVQQIAVDRRAGRRRSRGSMAPACGTENGGERHDRGHATGNHRQSILLIDEPSAVACRIRELAVRLVPVGVAAKLFTAPPVSET
jgi:hypothetical protein